MCETSSASLTGSIRSVFYSEVISLLLPLASYTVMLSLGPTSVGRLVNYVPDCCYSLIDSIVYKTVLSRF